MGIVLPLDSTPPLPPPTTDTPPPHTLKAPGRLPKTFQTADTGNQTSSDIELWKKIMEPERLITTQRATMPVSSLCKWKSHPRDTRIHSGHLQSQIPSPLPLPCWVKKEEECREKKEEDAGTAAAQWSKTANCDPSVLFPMLIFQWFLLGPLLPQISLVNAASDLFSCSKQSHHQETRESQVTTLKSTELYFSFPEEAWKN